MTDYLTKLRAAAEARDSMLCVGLDPERDRADPDLAAAVARCIAVVEATADIACCYKPNAAFWESYGPDGWRGLADVRAAVGPDVPVLFDCKRADVPNTMRAYASACFDALGMDAATVHAWHGAEALAEFARYEDKGVYVVCRTSNPGRLATDLDLWLTVADLAEEVNGNGNVGLVMGATAPEEAARARALHPRLPFLMPGIGRQGGDIDAAVAAAYTGDPASALIAVSSAILYADDPREAAMGYREEIRAAVRAHPPSDAIRLAHNPEANRYELRLGAELASIAEYTPSDGVLFFDHTQTEPRFRGRGFAERLVAWALSDVRSRGESIVATCWFVAEFIDNHPEYRDVLAESRT